MKRDCLKKQYKERQKIEKQLEDTKEILMSLVELFEKKSKPRMQYKKIKFALHMAIKAVDKQTPKEVVDRKYCPECGKIVAFSHCERCGQRLKY